MLTSAVVWVAVGVCLGFLLAWGPLPWIAFLARADDWSFWAEAAALLGAVAAGCLMWAYLAVALDRVRRRQRSPRRRLAVQVTLVGCSLLSAWAWAAERERSEEPVLEMGGRFAFGTSLTRERMISLKREGFVGIVSLLHPDEPADRGVMLVERRWAEAMGFEFASAPMQPALSLNEGSLDVLQRVARGGAGPYYVHAGRDPNRLQVARNILIRATGEDEALADRLADVRTFERGPVLELEEGLFLTPFPTDSELLNHYLGGSVRTVLSLLDPENPADLQWIEREAKVLSPFGITLHQSPVREEPFDPGQVLRAVDVARSLPRPLVVQAFLTPSVASEAFVQAFRRRVPPLPPRLFETTLVGGEARVVAPNVAIGPRPVGREFRMLYNMGIRTIAEVGGVSSPAVDEDRDLSRVAGLDWHRHDGTQSSLLLQVGSGGPWYLYGPGIEELAERIAQRYGPAVPDSRNAPADSMGPSEEGPSGPGEGEGSPSPEHRE